jgi:hypothetical protein
MRPSRRLVARQSESFTRNKRDHSLFIGSMAVLAVVSWLSVFSHLTFLKMFTISVVEIQGVEQDIHGAVRAAATDALKGDYFHIVSRANSFFYPRSRVIDATLAASPRIEEVEVKRNRLNSIVITVREKAPAALVCAAFPDFNGGEIAYSGGDECAFADEHGFLYRKAPAIAGTMYNRYYIPSLAEIATSSEALLGRYATSTAEFAGLQDFYELLKKNEIGVHAILFKSNGEYEAYIKNPVREGSAEAPAAVVYFNNARPLPVQMDNLILFWNHALEEARAAKRTPAYQYIDVRYGPNVFFREVL